VAKTYANLITESRELLQDTLAPYRYTDDLLLNMLNRGLQEIARLRPDAFWDTFAGEDIVVPEIATGDLPDTFALDMMFFTPLVSFVVAWAEIVDDEFTTDGRAAQLFANFKTGLLAL
jgi:hypothetical protein